MNCSFHYHHHALSSNHPYYLSLYAFREKWQSSTISVVFLAQNTDFYSKRWMNCSITITITLRASNHPNVIFPLMHLSINDESK
jgi:hypothetical protein